MHGTFIFPGVRYVRWDGPGSAADVKAAAGVAFEGVCGQDALIRAVDGDLVRVRPGGGVIIPGDGEMIASSPAAWAAWMRRLSS